MCHSSSGEGLQIYVKVGIFIIWLFCYFIVISLYSAVQLSIILAECPESVCHIDKEISELSPPVYRLGGGCLVQSLNIVILHLTCTR